MTFQHKTTFSLKTRDQLMSFVMLSKYHIGKILAIYSISAIFTHKSQYASFPHRVFRNPSCYFVSEQTRVASVTWWLTILVTQFCAELDVVWFFIALKYCLSTVVWVL